MTGNYRNILNSGSRFTTADFFREMHDVPKSTVYSRIRMLVASGAIKRVGRGVYERTDKSAFAFQVSEAMQGLSNEVSRHFPYIDVCVWDLSPVNTLTQHLINFNVTIVDVDRDAVEAVYQKLRETHEKVITIKRMFDGLADYDGFILVRRLVTDAPTTRDRGVTIPTLEKFLVDLALDKEFDTFHGYEMQRIFSNAAAQYAIHRNRILRYAGRKNNRKQIEQLLTDNSSIN